MIRTQAEDEAYRVYVTDALQIIGDNTSRRVDGGRYLNKRYVELIKPQPVETRREAEIIEGIRKKLRGGEQG